jgi:hypothetical protein
MTLFVLCYKGLKTYPHADAKQRKKLLWPKFDLCTVILGLPTEDKVVNPIIISKYLDPSLIYMIWSSVASCRSWPLISYGKPFTVYSKSKIYSKIIEISPILKKYLFQIRDIYQFRLIHVSL